MNRVVTGTRFEGAVFGTGGAYPEPVGGHRRNVTGHTHDRQMLLHSVRCPICRRSGGAPCPECAELFVPLGPTIIPPGIDAMFAAFAYADAARPLVTGLKYRNQRVVTTWLADAMAAVLPVAERADVVTWAPTTPARRRERGFDQSELLARSVARRLGIRPRRLLARRPGHAQTGRGAAERRGDTTAFRPARRVCPPTVLLVDDVVTTGSTLSAAASSLRRIGARRVVGLTAAATPSPGT